MTVLLSLLLPLIYLPPAAPQVLLSPPVAQRNFMELHLLNPHISRPISSLHPINKFQFIYSLEIRMF